MSRRKGRAWVPVQLELIGVGIDRSRTYLYFEHVPIRRGRIPRSWQRIIYGRLRGVFFIRFRGRVLHSGATISVDFALSLLSQELGVRL